VAIGERILSKAQALIYLKERLADFLQIDLYRVGGITEGRKMCALAETFDVDMAFHNAHGPILNATSMQLDTSIPNFSIQECFYDWYPSWKRDLVYNGAPVENGYVSTLEKPGLGVEVDERVLEENKLKTGEELISRDEPLWVVKGTWRDAK
jgi:galactonate dehydratase